MSDLTEFYRARLDDEEANIRDCLAAGESNVSPNDLDDIEAKRQLLDWLQLIDHDAPVLDGAVRLLAQPYAAHQDYRPEWRPE